MKRDRNMHGRALNFRLHAFKMSYTRRSYKSQDVRMVVVTKDKDMPYPANFVCLLPLRIILCEKPTSAFVDFFGNESVDVAKHLLLEALHIEQDFEVKAEIVRRLKLLVRA